MEGSHADMDEEDGGEMSESGENNEDRAEQGVGDGVRRGAELQEVKTIQEGLAEFQYVKGKVFYNKVGLIRDCRSIQVSRYSRSLVPCMLDK